MGRIMENEICICAAIKANSGKIIRGQRHHDCIKAMVQRSISVIDSVQGFITSRNRFVSREDGRRLQDAAGIKSIAPGGYRGAKLYSEDIY